MLMIGRSGYRQANSLYILISYQPHINKIYLHGKDLNEAEYQLLNNRRGNSDLKQFNDSEAFIEHSNNINDIHKNIEE